MESSNPLFSPSDPEQFFDLQRDDRVAAMRQHHFESVKKCRRDPIIAGALSDRKHQSVDLAIRAL